jgi:hypothetical protein
MGDGERRIGRQRRTKQYDRPLAGELGDIPLGHLRIAEVEDPDGAEGQSAPASRTIEEHELRVGMGDGQRDARESDATADIERRPGFAVPRTREGERVGDVPVGHPDGLVRANATGDYRFFAEPVRESLQLHSLVEGEVESRPGCNPLEPAGVGMFPVKHRV